MTDAKRLHILLDELPQDGEVTITFRPWMKQATDVIQRRADIDRIARRLQRQRRWIAGRTRRKTP